MSGPTIAVIALIAGLLIGTSLVIGAPVFALPIVFVVVVALGLVELRRRRNEARSMQGLRDEAKADAVEFTARDKRTTVESAD